MQVFTVYINTNVFRFNDIYINVDGIYVFLLMVLL